MIVKCASCQTRFKIGDDKVTEKGVKVRCTKCSTVFTVKKGDGGGEPSPADLPKSPVSKAPVSKAPKRNATVQVQAAGPAAATPLSDLLGDSGAPPPDLGAALAPAAPPAPSSLSDDPFAAFLLSQPAAARAAPPSQLLPGEFSLAALPAPTPLPPAATASADLLGFGASWPEAPSPAPPSAPLPGPDPFETALDPLGGALLTPASLPPPPPDPFGSLPADPFGDLPAPAPSPATQSFADYGAEFDSAGLDPLAGLSLNPGAVAAGQSDPPPSPAFDEGIAATPGASDDLFDRAPKPVLVAPVPSPPSRVPTQDNLEVARPPARERVRRSEAEPEGHASPGEDKPLSARIFNGVAGASVVVLALLFFVVSRNGGRLDLRDPLSAVFTAFGFSRPVPVRQSLPTRITDSGFYQTLRGEPVLFVRGQVRNLSGAATRVALKLEIEAQGQVVATSEGLPGASPTPEDLFNLKDSADAKALADRLAQTAALPLAPGASRDFLLVAAELPAGLREAPEELELRVSARPLVQPPLPQPDPPSKGALQVVPLERAGAGAAAALQVVLPLRPR